MLDAAVSRITSNFRIGKSYIRKLTECKASGYFLTSSQIKVGLFVAAKSDSEGNSFAIPVSLLCEQLDISKRTLHSAVKTLIECGILQASYNASYHTYSFTIDISDYTTSGYLLMTREFLAEAVALRNTHKIRVYLLLLLRHDVKANTSKLKLKDKHSLTLNGLEDLANYLPSYLHTYKKTKAFIDSLTSECEQIQVQSDGKLICSTQLISQLREDITPYIASKIESVRTKLTCKASYKNGIIATLKETVLQMVRLYSVSAIKAALEQLVQSICSLDVQKFTTTYELSDTITARFKEELQSAEFS